MKHRRPAGLFIFFFLSFGLFLTACSQQPQSVVLLGAQASVQDALVWIALDMGAYEREGVKVEIKPYPSGKRALQGLLRGDVELAVVAETPMVIAVPEHPDLRLFATVGQSDNNVCILGRRDHGIETARDLKGKTVATQKGSAVHFFLSSFLLDAGISKSDVEVRFLPVEALADALVSGEVDAISMRDPVLETAEERLGEKAVRLCRPGLYTKTYNLVGWSSFTSERPGVMESILRALNRAALLARREPARAQALLEQRLEIPPHRIRQIWNTVEYRLSLNQALLVSLQEELRWAVEAELLPAGLLEPGRVPNLVSLFEPKPLQKVLPEAVGIIGLTEATP